MHKAKYLNYWSKKSILKELSTPKWPPLKVLSPYTEEYLATKKINSGEISGYLEEYLKKLMKIKEDSINTGYDLIRSDSKNLY